MSVLETPRIVFNGKISWDPIVTNNYQQFYDEDTAWTVFEKQESVNEFRNSVITKGAVYNASHTVDPQTSSAGGLGNWNPHGTHRSVFYDNYITNVDTGSGFTDQDPFVTAPANFKGMLVDCEPYGPFSSQLFFDSLSLGIEGGCRIFAPRSHRITARYINFTRLPSSVYGFAASVASVNWQTSFSKDDGLVIDAHNSPALQALSLALENDDVLGVTVRFNAYSTHYYGAKTDCEIDQLETDLVEKLANGGFQPNPARSHITGVVGLWRKGEPVHEPGDTALLSVSNKPFVTSMATAFARVDDTSITLDLSNCIPETDLALTKLDLGTLQLITLDASNNATQLGDISYAQYNKKAYDSGSGILRLTLDSTQVQAARNGTIELKGTVINPNSNESETVTYLKENSLRAIPDDPNLYIDFGESKTSQVRVFNKGQPAGANIVVSKINTNTGVIETQSTDSSGIANFTITGEEGSVIGYLLEPSLKGKTPDEISTQTTTYMYVRTLPGNDSIAELAPTWENVYNNCLANWNAMAPCMDNWLDLKDEDQVRAYGPTIRLLTAPENFESFLYMPVTRDMTARERSLLYRFLDTEHYATFAPNATAEDLSSKTRNEANVNTANEKASKPKSTSKQSRLSESMRKA